MSTAFRSAALTAALVATIIAQYLIVQGYGHHVAFISFDNVPKPVLHEHLLVRVLFATCMFAGFIALLMDSPSLHGERWTLFDKTRRSRYHMAFALAGVVSLIVLFAFLSFPDMTTWGVIAVDIALAIGTFMRIRGWLSDGPIALRVIVEDANTYSSE